MRTFAWEQLQKHYTLRSKKYGQYTIRGISWYFFLCFFLGFCCLSTPEAPIPVSFVGDRVQQGRLLISAANVSVPSVSWRNGMVRDVPAVISAQLRLVEESCLRTVFRLCGWIAGGTIDLRIRMRQRFYRCLAYFSIYMVFWIFRRPISHEAHLVLWCTVHISKLLAALRMWERRKDYNMKCCTTWDV